MWYTIKGTDLSIAVQICPWFLSWCNSMSTGHSLKNVFTINMVEIPVPRLRRWHEVIHWIFSKMYSQVQCINELLNPGIFSLLVMFMDLWIYSSLKNLLSNSWIFILTIPSVFPWIENAFYQNDVHFHRFFIFHESKKYMLKSIHSDLLSLAPRVPRALLQCSICISNSTWGEVR
jgi:hypothetical protein